VIELAVNRMDVRIEYESVGMQLLRTRRYGGNHYWYDYQKEG
jgi:hypothetical protein